MEPKQAANGVNSCVSCGSSDVSFDGSWLVCGYCHRRWNTAVLADQLHLSDGIENLVGTAVLTGAKDIDTSSLVTVECSGCGATVTINSASTLQVTCHWCRQVLSLDRPIDNGAIPDAILPFSITREDALSRMVRYVSEHGKYASPEFKRDFANYATQSVYLPYLVADGNVTVRLDGQAWVEGGQGGETEYPVFTTDKYAVMREADLAVDDVAIEARSTRTKLFAAVSTTNIINAIQPFDVKSAVRFDASYIADGVMFEKRDVEVATASDDVAGIFATIGRGYVNQTLTEYTGGVRWDAEQIAIKGTRWVSMLLPVWLYAFKESTPTGPMMHYIAVNGRTGETEGSVPTDQAGARRSGRNWGLAAAAISGGPVLVAIPIFAVAIVSGGVDLPTALLVAVISLALAAVPIAIGKRAAGWRRDYIAKQQRNPLARFVPEHESKFTPTRFERNDQHLRHFVHPGGPDILGRNDNQPSVRAEYFKVSSTSGPLPPPPADLSLPMTSPLAPWGARIEASGRAFEGQLSSGPRPGEQPPQGFRVVWNWPVSMRPSS